MIGGPHITTASPAETSRPHNAGVVTDGPVSAMPRLVGCRRSQPTPRTRSDVSSRSPGSPAPPFATELSLLAACYRASGFALRALSRQRSDGQIGLLGRRLPMKEPLVVIDNETAPVCLGRLITSELKGDTMGSPAMRNVWPGRRTHKRTHRASPTMPLWTLGRGIRTRGSSSKRITGPVA